jgi:hypothetical protein
MKLEPPTGKPTSVEPLRNAMNLRGCLLPGSALLLLASARFSQQSMLGYYRFPALTEETARRRRYQLCYPSFPVGLSARYRLLLSGGVSDTVLVSESARLYDTARMARAAASRPERARVSRQFGHPRWR